MPALITTPIPQQGFEFVRDQIGAILKLEIANQKALDPSRFPETAEIWLERTIPADSSDEVSINVHVSGALYGNMTQMDAQGRTLYNIDIDTSGMQTELVTGSEVSVKMMHKYIGIVMYIFRSAFYRTLGLQGKIGGTYVEQFQTLDPNRKEDTDFTSFTRIQIAVRIQETTIPWQGLVLLGNDTTVKLDLTEKGYKFVLNN
jgi:hypothetical protein